MKEMYLNQNIAVETFQKIKNKGWHRNTKTVNGHGGHGNTLESCFGVVENNLKEPDWHNFEIKSVKEDNTSMISLFSSIPDYPNESGQYLINKYGKIGDDGLRRFYATLRGTEEETQSFGKPWTRLYKKHDLKIRISKEDQRMYFIERVDSNDTYNVEAYWELESIRKKTFKMNDIIFGNLKDIKKVDNDEEYYWDSIEIFWGLNFDNFIEEILHANIQFDFRCGVYKSPPEKRGKLHDRGSAFRLKATNWLETCKRVWKFHMHFE